MSSTVRRAPGIKGTDLQQHDLSVPGREVIQNRVELGPEAPFVTHKHPGFVEKGKPFLVVVEKASPLRG